MEQELLGCNGSCLTKRLKWLLVFISFSIVANTEASEEGRLLAEQVYNRPSGKDSLVLTTMTLKRINQSDRVRELSAFTINHGEGERWMLIRFKLPSDIRNTALLTLDHPGEASNQWVYLPALDRVRLIASNRKSGRFVGSDFTYEDLRDREPDMDEHDIDGVTKVGGQECTVLISVPNNPDNSSYSKRVSCVHIDTLIPLRIEFYKNGQEKPVKRLLVEKLKKVQGYWTVLQSTMYDLESGSQTRLVAVKLKYDLGLPDNLFSKRWLSDPSKEMQYDQL